MLVVPIPKINTPDLNKVRLIMLLPLPSKILEKLIFKEPRNVFEGARGPEQHVSQRRASTITALLKVVDSDSRTFDDSNLPVWLFSTLRPSSQFRLHRPPSDNFLTRVFQKDLRKKKPKLLGKFE